MKIEGILLLVLRENFNLAGLIKKYLMLYPDMVVGNEPAEQAEAVPDCLHVQALFRGIAGDVIDSLSEGDAEAVCHLLKEMISM
jgi:hypothetical protein